MSEKLSRFFKMKERKTDVRTEIMAGITTFMTVSYILVVNPSILSEAGMDRGAVFTATIIASVVAILLMGLYANMPFVLAPGMGLNAFFTYSVVLKMGKSWEFALTAVFLEGLVFILLSFFKVREAIFSSIPLSLKKAVSVGIGLFIALIGLTSVNIIVQGEGVILALGDIYSKEALVFFFAFLVMSILSVRKVKGSLLIGIVSSTILALILGVTKLPESGKIFSLPPSLSPIAFKLEFHNIFTLEMLAIVFTFLFVDIFDTVGTLTGVAAKANMLDEKGDLPNVSKALMADAIGTTVGALIGTSTVTTFVESASGVAEGGRTGLTALSSGALFLVSLFLFPLFSIVPPAATSAALVIVGVFMMSPILEVDLNDYSEAIPAFVTIAMMPFGYSIAEGISFGMMTYVILKVTGGKKKEVSPLMVVLALIFLFKLLAPVIFK
ncbi:NCS2 family permease [Lagierella sp.]|uniref:NCS2 family permease n=1 Tax=Lagierella sp. TaxID=2849657 RepID=UPI00262B52B7|nr:NCS2 family permease [Lagierella sp.]